MIRRLTTIFASVALTLGLGACDMFDDFPDYRYRLTVEVDTPHGLKTGSSVIEVETREVATIQDSTGRTFRSRMRGEAVAADIGPGQTLFALLGKPDNPEYGKAMAQNALKPERTTGGDLEGYKQHLQQMMKVKGPRELPREHWPFMVAFRDINDPASVFEVKPGEVADVFGAGTSIRRITVELTDDDVTTGIEERLPWLGSWRGALVKRKPGQSMYEKPPVHRLTEGAFKSET